MQETKPEVVSQKNSVFNFVTEAIAAEGRVKGEGEKLKELVTKEIRKSVRLKLFAAAKAGQMDYPESYDDSKLKKYCSGLINNWLKKDPRFN